jgi:uncharacterized protein
MIKRSAEDTIRAVAASYKAVIITGPRQSGKTTLTRSLFADYTYVSLEDLDTRQFAFDDPRGFLSQYDNHVIIDEVQRVPDILSYLQTKLDSRPEHAQYILTGSQNFLLSQHVGQTLVGRTALITLLPLTLDEISEFQNAANYDAQSAMLQGSYPGIYDQKLEPSTFYSSYVSLYIERDVRDLRTIDNLPKFQRFLMLCAGRAGRVLNMHDLSNTVGVDVKTIDAWIGVLEASFIAYRLQPYAANISKRLTKMPKLYFYDTGILCYLLGIRSQAELIASHFRGSIFENMVNSGVQPRVYFIRDQYNEVDCVFETSSGLALAEVKAASTFISEYSAKLAYFGELLDIPVDRRFVIYSGATQLRSDVRLVNVADMRSSIFDTLNLR